MTTTGFWPVRGRLKDVLNYAENPNKITAKQYLDKDLQNALRYAENSDKTDEQMFVSGINCSKNRAYEEMCAVKKRYGERGKVIAYHGYQSFQSGEVTPEEAHRIGVETARRMWGERFQVVVTTHLNTQNLHNHFILNSLSFKDGKKYRNKIGDHMELRRVSDEVCREYGKSVLENSQFYGGDKAYWIRKSGQLPHKDMLRKDVDEALANICSPVDFEIYLRSLGYKFVRNFKYEHPSAVAPDWQKPVRISSLGKDYSRQATSSYPNRRFCVEKRLTKPRVCGIIFPSSERGSPRSNKIFRGIAQLVEQRSPNVNLDLIPRMITGFFRFETSVSSLFRVLDFASR